ncbi:MAG: sulfotransferase family 2 domain-containing protein [Pseudomonadales bacterium]
MNFGKFLAWMRTFFDGTKDVSRLPILFLHIPKTAGTSFCSAAEKTRSIPEVLRDYGPQEESNTGDLHEALYIQKSPEKVQSILESRRDYLLSGHFNAEKYLEFFYPYEVVTFVREPVERIMSSFEYARRKRGYAGNLEDFVSAKGRINLQSQQIFPLSTEHIGFIGITDKFEQSINLLNQMYRLRLKAQYSNSNPDKKLRQKYKITDSQRALIQQYNQQDRDVYLQANMLMAIRKKYLDMGIAPIYGSYDINNDSISGHAYQAWSNQALSLTLSLNGKPVATTLANQYSPLPYKCKQPRKGYIGFEFAIEPQWANGNQIEVYETSSEQPLMNYGTNT